MGATGWTNIDPEQEQYEQEILASVNDTENTDERTVV
jgi:hypothetical protein